jgi:hypothetical protein
MSDFIHSREFLNQGDIVVIDCDTQCNCMILTDSEFNNYKSRRRYQYHGGHYKMFPVRIAVPISGNWNVVVDLGGGRASIKCSISYIK